jgi:hypothetical protein
VLTFAYFSTEWDMSQPFSCECHTPRCLGTIAGAKYVDRKILECVSVAFPSARHGSRHSSTYFVNEHIRELLDRQHSSK